MTDTPDNEENVVHLESSISHSLDFDGLRVLAVLESAEAEACIGAYLTDFEGVDHEIITPETFAKQGVKIHEDTPDIIVIEVQSEADAAEKITQFREDPENEFLHICILMKAPSKAATVKLLSLGADDILSITPDEVELTGSLARTVAHRPESREHLRRNRFRTFVFLHASGGAGATTIAVNAAVQLQRSAKKLGGKACLLDFDVQFGDADLHLDLPMRSNLIDLVKAPDRLDRRMLDNLMIQGPEDLQVLTAPDHLLPLDAYSRETIESVLTLARRHYRYVVVDMPVSLTSWTDAVLRRADYIFVVTQVNVVALRAARRLIDTLQQENIGNVPIVALANRFPSKGPGRKISIGEAEKTLCVPIKTQIVSDFGLVVDSLDQGIPAALQRPMSKYARAINDIVDGLDPATEHSGRNGKTRFPYLNFGGSDV